MVRARRHVQGVQLGPFSRGRVEAPNGPESIPETSDRGVGLRLGAHAASLLHLRGSGRRPGRRGGHNLSEPRDERACTRTTGGRRAAQQTREAPSDALCLRER
jgi:hypothetical protein